MFPNLTAAADWIQTYLINGFLANLFTYVSNFLIGFLQIFAVK